MKKGLRVQNCFYQRCYLENDYECGEIGIKIEESFSEGNTEIYEIQKISKYTWMDTGDCLIQVSKGHEQEFLNELHRTKIDVNNLSVGF